jgi:hypothetical protein
MASLVATAAVRFAGEGAGGSRDVHGSERCRSGSGAVGTRRDDAELRNGCAVASRLAWRVHTAAVVVLLVVVTLAVGLSVSARAVHDGNEERL